MEKKQIVTGLEMKYERKNTCEKYIQGKAVKDPSKFIKI